MHRFEVGPSLHGHDVLLVSHWPPDEDVAALESGYRVAEDEVDGAVDELPLRVHIESALVAPLNLQR